MITVHNYVNQIVLYTRKVFITKIVGVGATR